MGMADAANTYAEGTTFNPIICGAAVGVALRLRQVRYFIDQAVAANSTADMDWEPDFTGTSNDCRYGYDPFGVMELPEEGPSKPPKYDPFGARQLWQPGYPRVRPLRRGDLLSNLTPRYNQVQHTVRPLRGRRGRK